MPRRSNVIKRQVPPDSKYGSYVLARIIRKVMRDGKKATAEGILYDALDIINERTKNDPLEVLDLPYMLLA